MIELPDLPAPNGCAITLLDFSLTLRPPTGGEVQKVTRAGSRFRIDLTFPPMEVEDAQVFIARLLRAKREGSLRVDFPLLDAPQGLPGSPVVDGAGQAGTTLRLRAGAVGYDFKEGSWLSLIDPTGQPYLHNVTAPAEVGTDGKVILSIEPPLRYPFPDGAQVLIQQPVVEGFVDGPEWGWDISLAHHYGLAVSIEEAA